MQLPPFLRFLAPRFKQHDGIALLGHIRVERSVAGGPAELVHDGKNFIVDGGITALRNVLIGVPGAAVGGFSGSIFRMAIGDGGTPSGDLYTPKPLDPTWPARTALFHEMLRQDISTFTAPTDSSMRFLASFSSADIDDTSYQLSQRVVNEACLIVGDGILGGDKKQVNKTPPDTADADEKMVSMRTFKSASFDNLESIVITIIWTLTLAKS